MFNTRSIRFKLLSNIAVILLLLTVCAGSASYLLNRNVLEKRVDQIELPQTMAAIRNMVEQQLSVPIAYSRALATNTYLEDWRQRGEPRTELPAFQALARKMKSDGMADAVFWVSEKTQNYYIADGLLKQVNPSTPRDSWFYDFLKSRLSYDLNIDKDESDQQFKLFVNYLSGDPATGNGVVTGVGVSVNKLADQIKQIHLGQTGVVMLVDYNGIVKIHPDPQIVDKRIPLAQLPGMNAIAQTLMNKQAFTLAKMIGPDGADWLAVSSYLPSSRGYVVGVVPVEELYGGVKQAAWTITALFLACSLLALLLIALLISRMVHPLSRLAHSFLQIADGSGDLSRQIQVESQDEIGQTAQAFNGFVHSLHDMVVNVRDDALDVTDKSELLNQATDKVRTLADSQSQVLRGAVDRMGALSGSIARISKTADEVTQLADETGQSSADSRAKMTALVQDINSMNITINHLASSMDKLSERSNEVNKIICVIQDIAEQTNLLALNAAIEAARAGEQGRGFAVVADEVRKLAGRSASATVEISQIVRANISETSTVSDEMRKTREVIADSLNKVQEANQAMGEVENHNRILADRIGEISSATHEQSGASEDISSSFESVAKMADEARRETDSASASANELQTRAKSLRGRMDRFRL
jgi:methyl-accepting chemotaxis protein